MAARIPVLRIWLNRAEGPTSEIGQRTVTSFQDADAVIRRWATSAPATGKGYDKVDYKIDWQNDHSYGGRFDMDRSHVTKSDILAQAVRDGLLFFAGLRRPSSISQEQYEKFLAERGFGEGSDQRKNALEALQTLEM